jgi:hypothetical protein
MSARIGHHIRSNIIGYVCLFWLMTGTAYAAVIVHSNGEVARDTIAGHNPPTGDHSNLIAGSVDTTDLAGRSVGAPKLAADAVTGPKVADNSLTGADIDESSLVGVQKGAGTDEIGHKLLAPGIGNFSTGVLIGFQDGELVAYCQVDADGTTVGGLQVGDDTGATGPLMVSHHHRAVRHHAGRFAFRGPHRRSIPRERHQLPARADERPDQGEPGCARVPVLG